MTFDKCQRCGNCCRGQGYVRLFDGEEEQIAAFLHISVAKFLDQYTLKKNDYLILGSQPKTADCIFLKQGHCLINPVKPSQCRSWPFWQKLYLSKDVYNFSRSYCQILKNKSYQHFKKTYLEYLSRKEL